MFSGDQKKPYAFLEVYSKGIGKRMVYLHQLVTGAFTQTDHIDGNTLIKRMAGINLKCGQHVAVSNAHLSIRALAIGH